MNARKASGSSSASDRPEGDPPLTGEDQGSDGPTHQGPGGSDPSSGTFKYRLQMVEAVQNVLTIGLQNKGDAVTLWVRPLLDQEVEAPGSQEVHLEKGGFEAVSFILKKPFAWAADGPVFVYVEIARRLEGPGDSARYEDVKTYFATVEPADPESYETDEAAHTLSFVSIGQLERHKTYRMRRLGAKDVREPE